MRTSASILVLILLLSGCGSPPQQEADRVAKPVIQKIPDEKEEEERPTNPALINLILVRAKVKSIDSVDSNSSVANLEIVHVYCGSAKLMGRSFRDKQMFEHMAGYPARERFELDEEGIWIIQSTKDGLKPSSSERLPFTYRSRKADSPRHAQAVAFSESLERYAKAKPEDRPTLAEKLAQDAIRGVGYWMVRTLGDTDEKFATELLEKWRKNYGELPLRSQIALDEVICIKEKEGWYTSPKRAEMLKSWVSGNADASHVREVLSRLEHARYKGALKGDRLLELVRIAVLNKDWPKEDRIGSIKLLSRPESVDPQPTYDWLFDQIRTHPDVDLRKEAARVLGTLGFDAKRIVAIEEHLATEKDPEIIKTLRDAIKKAKESEKK